MTRLCLSALLVVVSGAALAQSSGRGFVPEEACRPPLKFAAGACVAQCPAGYEDHGRNCTFRSMAGEH